MLPRTHTQQLVCQRSIARRHYWAWRLRSVRVVGSRVGACDPFPTPGGALNITYVGLHFPTDEPVGPLVDMTLIPRGRAFGSIPPTPSLPCATRGYIRPVTPFYPPPRTDVKIIGSLLGFASDRATTCVPGRADSRYLHYLHDRQTTPTQNYRFPDANHLPPPLVDVFTGDMLPPIHTLCLTTLPNGALCCVYPAAA